jgi:hypothetical protein
MFINVIRRTCFPRFGSIFPGPVFKTAIRERSQAAVSEPGDDSGTPSCVGHSGWASQTLCRFQRYLIRASLLCMFVSDNMASGAPARLT